MRDDDELPEERVFLYYLGNTLVVFGFLLFISVIVQGFASVGSTHSSYSPGYSISTDPGWHPSFNTPEPSSSFGPVSEPNPMRALVGMGFMFVGGILSGIGKAGLAGSGIKLDPKQQREEMKPWSRMAGGMVSDALEAVDLAKIPPVPGKEVIKVRCPKCRALNDEDAKFCKQCGKAI